MVVMPGALVVWRYPGKVVGTAVVIPGVLVVWRYPGRAGGTVKILPGALVVRGGGVYPC